MSKDGFKSFAEYWADGDWSEYVEVLHNKEGKNHSLAISEQPAGKFPDPGFSEFNIQLILKGSFRARVYYGSEGFNMSASPGTIVVAPPHVDSDYDIDGIHRVAQLAIDKDTMHRFKEQCDIDLPSDFGVLHSKAFFDPTVETLILRMIEHAMIDHPVSDLFLDDAANTILTSLFHRGETPRVSQNTAKPLSNTEVQKVSGMIDDRLETNLNIADLASVTSLSDYHFARAFKSATGMSPHQFVLRRRIARAKDLLTHGNLPLAEVAVAAGFSSQSHMTDTFREKVGATPGRYRSNFK